MNQTNVRIDRLDAYKDKASGTISDSWRMSFLAFNTICQITAYGEETFVKKYFEYCLRCCREYERLFSRTIPDSDIGRLNDAQGKRVQIDPRTADLLKSALGYCKASKGAFDITVAPFFSLWDFHAKKIPSRSDLKNIGEHVNWQALRVWTDDQKDKCFAQLDDPLSKVDLGGVAKGWIADELGLKTELDDIEGALINLGGNILVKGAKPDKSHWKIALRPPKEGLKSPIIELKEGSIVTSGIYERCFKENGEILHHILDPRTGWPVKCEWASASVVAKKSIDAEGFSTTLVALGPEKGMELAAEHPEIIQAYYLDFNGNVKTIR